MGDRVDGLAHRYLITGAGSRCYILFTNALSGSEHPRGGHRATLYGPAAGAGVFCCGLRVILMDGLTTDVPDTPANDEFFRRPCNGTRAPAFPQVRWLAAAESGTGALVGATFGPYTTGEQTMALDLLAVLEPGPATWRTIPGCP